MKNTEIDVLSIGKLKGSKRRAINTAQEELIKTEYLQNDKTLPLVIKPSVKNVNLIAWANKNRKFLNDTLLKYGAILFRNFNFSQVTELEQLIQAISIDILEYRYRASPRSQVGNRIYTSTDYPADQSIFPHNEHAYSPVFPLKIYFFCITPAQEGGETPIGDTRKIFKRIDPKIVQRFVEKNVMYVRSFGSGFGLPWQTVFQTTEKSVVEDYCRKNSLEFQWGEGDKLRTRQVGPAIVKHPQTGEKIWFNHATFFHVSTLEPTVCEALLSQLGEENLPNNTYYGDGSPIEASVLDELREAYLQEMIVFSWQQGDILLLDNMLTVHGRRQFVGARKVVVGMAEGVELSRTSLGETVQS